MSLVLQSSGGGQITIQEPTTASNFTQTLPAATGTVMVAGNMPAFSAYQTIAQTITGNSYTKVTFDVEEYDTNNNFASSRFTPTVAGYYQINGCCALTTFVLIGIFKNGTEYRRGAQVSINGSLLESPVSSIVYLNGTTDYVELYVYGAVTNGTANTEQQTWFNGAMVRAA